jgi:hypothetical protein
MLTWPWIPAVRRYVPSKLTIFDSPTPTVAAPEVLEKLTSFESNPEISTEYVPERSPVNEYWPLSSVAVSESAIPERRTVTPPSPIFSTVTVPVAKKTA